VTPMVLLFESTLIIYRYTIGSLPTFLNGKIYGTTLGKILIAQDFPTATRSRSAYLKRTGTWNKARP
jgi:hypothetical protein